MDNQYDVGAKEDFDNMTNELGREVLVYVRNDTLNYENQQSDTDFYGTGVTETVFMQELNETHDVVREGQMDVGDIKFTFKADSVAAKEGKVVANNKDYKILRLTTVRGMNNDEILYIKAFGKELPDR
jgi:hypothetical protein